MSRIHMAFIALAWTVAVVNTQMTTLSTPTCLPTTTLSTLGFTSQAASVVNNGTCKNYYSTNGACVSPNQIIAYMNTNTQWLQNQAINANNFALQYINATIFFQTQAGYITPATTVPTNTSWFGSFSSYFKNIYNRATSLFLTASVFVQSIFNNNINAVNACFQAWSNVTNGAYCVATSSNNVSYTINAPSNFLPLTLAVDPTTTGNALQACAPLLDTYCSLTYGISISNSALPFNTTFDWSDNGLQLSDCYNFRNQTNCSACGANLNILWTNLFNSGWIKFVPSASAITYLGSFLTATTPFNTSSFKPILQTQSNIGISLTPSSATNGENIYVDGQNSGQVGVIYGSAYSLLTGLVSALLVLMF